MFFLKLINKIRLAEYCMMLKNEYFVILNIKMVFIVFLPTSIHCEMVYHALNIAYLSLAGMTTVFCISSE
jgi:hypothetical protein